MDDSSEELWVGEVEYKMLNGPQPGVISVVRDMLGQTQNITVLQLSTAKGFIFRSISKFCSKSIQTYNLVDKFFKFFKPSQ